MHSIHELRASVTRASTESERSRSDIAREMLALRLGRNQLGFSEYFDYGLYSNDLSIQRKREFVGWRKFALLARVLVDDFSLFLSLDKSTSYALFKGHGLPFPEIKASFARPCSPKFCQSLNSINELEKFLREESSYPVYVKPSHGSYGKGNALLRCRDGQELVFGDDSRMGITEYCTSLLGQVGLGWIFQEPLVPHNEIAQLCGQRISGVRVHSFMKSDGPMVFRAIWKINVGTSDSDNFHHGASGNMLADVDVNTGRVTRVVHGMGFDQEVDPGHPITGKPLVEFCLPHWPDVKRLVCQAHHLFPGFISPGWDVAICDEGPVLLEVNAFGDIDLTQHAAGRGFVDENFMSLLDDWGLRHLVGRRCGLGERRNLENWRSTCTALGLVVTLDAAIRRRDRDDHVGEEWAAWESSVVGKPPVRAGLKP